MYSLYLFYVILTVALLVSAGVMVLLLLGLDALLSLARRPAQRRALVLENLRRGLAL